MFIFAPWCSYFRFLRKARSTCVSDRKRIDFSSRLWNFLFSEHRRRKHVIVAVAHLFPIKWSKLEMLQLHSMNDFPSWLSREWISVWFHYFGFGCDLLRNLNLNGSDREKKRLEGAWIIKQDRKRVIVNQLHNSMIECDETSARWIYVNQFEFISFEINSMSRVH